MLCSVSSELIEDPTIIHKEPTLCCGWRNASAADHIDKIDFVKLTFPVRERNTEMLTQIALDVSNPQSPRYGHYLTSKEVDELTAPDPDAVTLVNNWLLQFTSAVDISRNRTLTVSLTIPDAEKMLKTHYRYVVHEQTGRAALRASDFELPKNIENAVGGAVFGPHGLPIIAHPPIIGRKRSFRGNKLTPGFSLANVYPEH